MGENHSLGSHLRSARKWLSKAEQAFDDRNELKGQLHLMLAQAEMQYAHEAKQPGKSRRMSWQLQATAVVLAGLVVSTGLGLAYFGHSSTETANVVTPLASPVTLQSETKVYQPEMPSRSVQPNNVAQAAPSTRAATESAAVQVVSDPKPDPRPSAAAKQAPTALKAEEVEQLVRVAGKSLRTP